MAWNELLICHRCDRTLDQPGALLISPPQRDGILRKFHICTMCYPVLESMLVIPNPRDPIHLMATVAADMSVDRCDWVNINEVRRQVGSKIGIYRRSDGKGDFTLVETRDAYS